MSQNQPQRSSFPLRAHPHRRTETATRCALAGLLSGTHDDLKLPNDTSFSTRCLHPSTTATMTSP
jgi:hypothetical protein